MTTEGLENLKAVLRKTIELQVNAVLVMATLQSIYLDEEDELDRDTEEHLRSAIVSARGCLPYAMGIQNQIRKAYEIEKALSELVSELDKIRDDDEVRAGRAQEAGACSPQAPK